MFYNTVHSFWLESMCLKSTSVW